MVAVTEPETVVRLDTPAGLVEARVAVEDGRARDGDAAQRARRSCTPATARSRSPGSARVAYDMAFGGNFYAIVDAASVGLEVDPARARRADRARRARSWPRSTPPTARCTPSDERIAGCHHVIFHAPGRDGADARAATAIHPGWLDRSPCGTGTSARMAQLHARGELAVGEAFVNESVIGTRFTGRIVGGDRGRRAAGDRARDHRPRLDHRHGPVPARRRGPVPGRLRPVTDVRRRGRRRRHRRRGDRARAGGPRRRRSRSSTAARSRAAPPGWARATCSAPTRTRGRSSS